MPEPTAAIELPHVDPSSVDRDIKASYAYIAAMRLNRKCTKALDLAVHVTAFRNGDPHTYWFNDTPTVREILGMEKK